MKQFIRYLSLIACVVVVGVWVWSYKSYSRISYFRDTYFVHSLSNWGYLVVFTEGPAVYGVAEGEPKWRILHGGAVRWVYQVPMNFRVLSIMQNRYGGITVISIPYWLLVSAISLLTLKLWYHPIKNWWRGTDRQGFEVEVKAEVKEN